MGLTVPDMSVKFRHPRTQHSGEIRPKNFDKYRPELASDVISGAAFDYAGIDVSAKFGASILNIGRIIPLFGRPESFDARLCSISLHLQLTGNGY